uniref:ADAMTS like 1 n=1 Tax=Eptatretus burgeri TaxID=7764 RepID=A0A8C4Q6Q0_EPTBU
TNLSARTLRGTQTKTMHYFMISKRTYHSKFEEDETDTTWDLWGLWSECSRTCDGGASYSMRRCLPGGSCVGRSIRYKSCSTEDCSSDSGDFRAQQCSAHNDMQHGGGLHEWLSVHDDPTSPCSLRCRARGSGIIVELAPKVLDGTRCYPGSLDMCISGICQAVGCDRRLGSRAREDNCGVCNGDGSSCRLVRDQYRPQPGVNKPEDTVIVIPYGSRHVKITLKGPDDLHIRTKTLQGHLGELSFMGNGSYEVENSSAVLQIFPTRKVLTIAGPIHADFTILDTAPGDSVVLFLFYQPIPHRWRRTDFFPCSSTCGGGYQLTSAECVDVRSRRVVSDHYCNYYPENKKPKPKLRECSFDLCPARLETKLTVPFLHFHGRSWDMSPWTSCSTSCGGGTQTRSVACVEEDSQGILTHMEEWKCTYAMRPPAVQPCKLFDCPKWMSQEWSPCTVTCGQGLRYRVVLCINHAGEHVGGCNSQIKPHVKEDCIASVPCFRPRVSACFLPHSWSACSVSCGAGQRTRALRCHVLLPFSQSVVQLPLEECLEAAGPPPPTQEPCFLAPCPGDGGSHEESTSTKSPQFDWEYGGFTHICSSSCGAGVQSRQVRCLRVLSHEADGAAVLADGSCSMAWPAEVEACNQRDCPPTWHTGHWNDVCYSHCGSPMRSRVVECRKTQADGGFLRLQDDLCTRPKPESFIYCAQKDCLAEWHASEWGQCSASCGAGIQQRDVSCQRLMGQGIIVKINVTECSRLEKPTITRPCLLQRCPGISTQKHSYEDRVYIPSPYDKIVSFPAGSIAYVFPKTTLVLKCPLQRFLRSRVRWEKDGEQIFPSPHHSLTRGGCLKIRCLQADDAGIYTCAVGTVKGSFIVKLISTEPGVNGPTLDISARHGVKPHHSLRLVEQKGGKREAEKNMLVPPAPPPMLLRLLSTGDGRRKGFSPLEDNESSMHSDEKHFELSVEDLSRKRRLDSSRSSSNAPRIASAAHNVPWLPARPPESYSHPQGVDSNSFGQKWTHLIQRYHGKSIIVQTIFFSRILRLPDRSLKILNPVESDAGVYTCTVSTDSGSDSESVLIAFAGTQSRWHEIPLVRRKKKMILQSKSSFFSFLSHTSSSCLITCHYYKLFCFSPFLSAHHSSRTNSAWFLHAGCPVLCSSSNIIKWFWKGQPLEITPLLNTQLRKKLKYFLYTCAPNTEYHWLTGSSISCSASCGGSGVARPSLQCIYNGVRPVFDSFCAGLPQPTIHSQPCNIRNCPPEWIIGPWSTCSPPCGSGMRRRSLSCQKLSASGVSLNIPIRLCPAPRPPDNEACGDIACLAWAVTPWGECTSQCVGPELGSQYRQVLCFFPNGTAAPDVLCDPKIRPGRMQNCSLSLCNVKWYTGHWAECTASCGMHGFQSRHVVCAYLWPGRTSPDHLCTWTAKPQTWRRCNIVPCMENCRDSSHYCETVRRLLLCQLSSYRARCCQACHGA